MIALRAAYVLRFAAFAGVAHCAAHDGQFDDDEVARLGAQRTPAIFVTCLGLTGVLDDVTAAARLRWVAVVIARAPDAVREPTDPPRTSGDVAAVLALRTVYELEHGALFEPEAFDRPSDVRARNLIGALGARRGYALWAVTWMQAGSILPEDLEAVLSPFLTLHTDMDLADGDDVLTPDLSATVTFPEPEEEP